MKTHSSPERLAEEPARALLNHDLRKGYRFDAGLTEAVFEDTVVVRTGLEAEIRVGGLVIRPFTGATGPRGKPLPGWDAIADGLKVYAPDDQEWLVGPGIVRPREIR